MLLLGSSCGGDDGSVPTSTDPPTPTISIAAVITDPDGAVRTALRTHIYLYSFIGAPENLDDDTFCAESGLSATQQQATIASTVAERAMVAQSEVAYGPDFNTREVAFADGLTGEVTVHIGERQDGSSCVLGVDVADPAIAQRFGLPTAP